MQLLKLSFSSKNRSTIQFQIKKIVSYSFHYKLLSKMCDNILAEIPRLIWITYVILYKHIWVSSPWVLSGFRKATPPGPQVLVQSCPKNKRCGTVFHTVSFGWHLSIEPEHFFRMPSVYVSARARGSQKQKHQ